MLDRIATVCWILTSVAVPAAMSADGAGAAGPCPGSGDCCVANGTPGCDDFQCCDLICFLDSFCCVAWDQECANLAMGLCGPEACARACPGEGDCCQPHNSPGCSDSFCCDLVCIQEPFCCDGVWTNDCVDLAGILCDELCPPSDPCPGEGNCCLSGTTPACDDAECCNTICEEDPFCCAVEWDSICVDLTTYLCTPICAGPCPSEGDCCTAHGGQGCSESTCCSAVCAADEQCCSNAWDESCVTLAGDLCGELCSGSCPGPESCCEMHASFGCSDAACCEQVCQEEPFCCFLSWGVDCFRLAQDLCGELCTGQPTCPGEGDCCSATGTPGCDNPACCERACAENSDCCTVEWTSACAALAENVCGLTCRCPSFGDFDGNGAVDLFDVAWFQRCFSGTDAGPVDVDCACADAAGNDDVDLVDYRAFRVALSRP